MTMADAQSAKPRPDANRAERKTWLEAQNRKVFKAALPSRDQVRAREMASFFARRLRLDTASPLEQRLWEVAVAYAEITNTGPARQQVRIFVRIYIRQQGIEAALLELQAWAKPHHCRQILIEGGAADLTCESVLVEFAHQFPADVVGRARLLLP